VAVPIIGLSKDFQLSEVDVALSFVQSLRYQEGMGYYQRYAVETLIDGRGDCSDKAVLFGGILSYLWYDWVFINLENHLAVGVWCPTEIFGTYVTQAGRRYYFCETTAEDKPVGYCYDDYINTPCQIEGPDWRKLPPYSLP
jgi:hypothetical protein